MAGPVSSARAPRFVELVGPAGAGKSTIAGALPSQDATIALGPNLWALPRGLLIASAVALLPTLVAAALSGNPFGAREIGHMIRMGALRRAAERAARRGGRTLVMDEGPVFGLAWLEVHHLANGNRSRARWRRRERDEWAGRLDAVVRLDAAPAELTRRIRSRAKPHAVKDRADRDVEAFIDRYRAAYDRVLADLAERGSLEVRDMPPLEGSIAESAARVRDVIREAVGER